MVATRKRTAANGSLTQSFHPTKKASSSSARQAQARAPNDAASKRPQKSHSHTDERISQSNSDPVRKAKKLKPNKADIPTQPLPVLSEDEIHLCTTIAVPPLSFSLEEGKSHLMQADPRFIPLVARIPMRVFEDSSGAGEGEPLESTDGSVVEAGTAEAKVRDLNLFRTLVTSILGQQVSWLAARAILYKFTRLWFPELPVTPDFAARPRESLPFPTPLQVRYATEGQLRSAGLSGQKVRYVTDIAERFSDGRLDVRKIMKMSEEECIEELVKIKGVGVWTAQMLLIFALRRPDVLPWADLGVQKGMVLLWCSGIDGPVISSAKAKPLNDVARQPRKEDQDEEEEVQRDLEEVHKVEDAVQEGTQGTDCLVDTSKTLDKAVEGKRPTKIPPMTALSSAAKHPLPPLPPSANLTPSQLTARKNGTKTKGNVYLSPSEMEALAQTWKPYRSLASVIMWALVDS